MEDFGYLKEEKSKFSELLKRFFLIGATLFSIACFIYVTISAYNFVYNDQNNNVETIKSPEGEIKVTEEALVNVDTEKEKTNSIYDDIFGSRKESLTPKIHLAPEPTLPPKREKKPAVVVDSIDVMDKVDHKAQKDQRIVVYTDQKKEEAGSKDLLTKGSVPAKETHTNAAVTKKSSNRGLIKVQIAALTSQSAVDDYWKKLNRLNSRLFSGLKLSTEKVDLGKRGLFYRVQIGNFANQIEAEEFCKSYVSQTQKSKADCIMVE